MESRIALGSKILHSTGNGRGAWIEIPKPALGCLPWDQGIRSPVDCQGKTLSPRRVLPLAISLLWVEWQTLKLNKVGHFYNDVLAAYDDVRPEPRDEPHEVASSDGDTRRLEGSYWEEYFFGEFAVKCHSPGALMSFYRAEEREPMVGPFDIEAELISPSVFRHLRLQKHLEISDELLIPGRYLLPSAVGQGPVSILGRPCQLLMFVGTVARPWRSGHWTLTEGTNPAHGARVRLALAASRASDKSLKSLDCFLVLLLGVDRGQIVSQTRA